jgi:hypothetical protein
MAMSMTNEGKSIMMQKLLVAAMIGGVFAGCGTNEKATTLSGSLEDAHKAAEIAAKAPFTRLSTKNAPGKSAAVKKREAPAVRKD